MDKFEEFKKYIEEKKTCRDFKVENAIACFEKHLESKEKEKVLEESYNEVKRLCKQYSVFSMFSEPVYLMGGVLNDNVIGINVTFKFRDG